ncbi:MAG TPA: hypothetical protein VNW89_03545 [Stellaceae bacterium]|nr:hypothetical protein [Stellaceae bacterium]
MIFCDVLRVQISFIASICSRILRVRVSYMVNECEACFREALATAREQGTRGYELRAAVSFAQLRRDQGRRAEARELVAPVYGWFTEGFGTTDLKAAKALLDELGGT